MATLDELAAQFGGSTAPISEGFQEAPTGIRVPWSNLPPAKADEARLRAADYARKKIDANAAVVAQGEAMQRKFDEFSALNRENRTGEWYSDILPNVWGLNKLEGAPEQRMTQILSKLAPSMRIEGSGTTSDRDIAMYIKSLPNVGTKGSVNQLEIDSFNKDLARSKAKLQFLNEYYNTYGHLDGADTVWAKDYSKQFEAPPAIRNAGAKTKNKTNTIFNEADSIIKGGK
jgi:hypothetical protein